MSTPVNQFYQRPESEEEVYTAISGDNRHSSQREGTTCYDCPSSVELNDQSEDSEDEIIFTSASVMAQKLEMPLFYGNPGQCAEKWFQQYESYTALNNIKGQNKSLLIQFYMKDHAAAFYDSLSEEVRSDYQELRNAFTNRFNGKDGLDSDLEILSLQQQPTESISSFFTRFLKVTNDRGYPEGLLVSILLKGLSPQIKQIVMPQNHTDVENIRKAAVLAEKTLASTTCTNVAVTFMDKVSEQIQSLAQQISQLQMRQDYSKQSGPYRQQQQAASAQDIPRTSPLRIGQADRRTGCQRCGEGRKHSLEQCKAKNALCNYCFKSGHLYQCCFQRLRDEKKGQQ